MHQRTIRHGLAVGTGTIPRWRRSTAGGARGLAGARTRRWSKSILGLLAMLVLLACADLRAELRGTWRATSFQTPTAEGTLSAVQIAFLEVPNATGLRAGIWETTLPNPNDPSRPLVYRSTYHFVDSLERRIEVAEVVDRAAGNQPPRPPYAGRAGVYEVTIQDGVLTLTQVKVYPQRATVLRLARG